MPANSFPGPNFRPESVHAEGKLLSPQRELPISQRPDARRKRKDRTDGLPASTPPAGGPRAVGGAWSARVSGYEGRYQERPREDQGGPRDVSPARQNGQIWFQSAGLYGKPEMFEAMEGGQSSQAPLRALDPTGRDSLSNGFDRVVYKTLTMVQSRQEREDAGALFFS
ncbi:serine/threonine protein kinase [Marssonina coronariae]|uniref:Serine/threonine protein kinase n=1 Tax=Diplocarpon coronariae TaxID=2795749 RepID=A0A218ZG05_9HELO|nr:serine/threonine protein kinase [Marssonina coronariae]